MLTGKKMEGVMGIIPMPHRDAPPIYKRVCVTIDGTRFTFADQPHDVGY